MAAVGAVLAACGESPAPPELFDPGIALVSGALSDTVTAEPTEALTFRVTGPDRLPRPGVVVRFEPVPYERSGYVVLPLEVARTADARFRSFVVDTTDARGRASVRLRLGTAARPAQIQVTAPELGLQHTATVTILPGGAARVVAEPSDTALFGGGRFTLRASAVDLYGNPRPDPVSVSALAGPVTTGDGSVVTAGSQTGRARVVARSGQWTDTAHVSVVPHGWLAVQRYEAGNGGPLGTVVLQLDGSEARVVAPGLDNRVIPKGFGWAADGEWLYVPRENRIHRVGRTGGESVVREFAHPVTSVRASRDGAWILFSLVDSYWQNVGIHRMRPDGTGVERLASPRTYGLREYDASPSPDGRYVAHVAAAFDEGVRVWDTVTGRHIGARVPGKRVAWSPVADQIAYHDGHHLRLMRPDGTLLRQLAGLRGDPAAIDWSPDGDWLVVSFVWGAPVTVVNAHTGEVLPLGYAASMGEAAWRR